MSLLPNGCTHEESPPPPFWTISSPGFEAKKSDSSGWSSVKISSDNSRGALPGSVVLVQSSRFLLASISLVGPSSDAEGENKSDGCDTHRTLAAKLIRPITKSGACNRILFASNLKNFNPTQIRNVKNSSSEAKMATKDERHPRSLIASSTISLPPCPCLHG